jgi:uncharacterized protein YndB with AHSA1/START domain
LRNILKTCKKRKNLKVKTNKLNKTIMPKQELTITRVFDAPIEMVWKAISESEQTRQWWGPEGYTCPDCNVDFRVGGKYLISMQDKDGKKIWSTGVYKEIIPNKKIVSTDSFADENGNVVSSDYYGMPGMPLEMIVTITLKEVEGKTELKLVHAGMPEGEILKGANIGWNSSLDKLEKLLQS